MEYTPISAQVHNVLRFCSVAGKNNRKREVKKIEENDDRRSTGISVPYNPSFNF